MVSFDSFPVLLIGLNFCPEKVDDTLFLFIPLTRESQNPCPPRRTLPVFSSLHVVSRSALLGQSAVCRLDTDLTQDCVLVGQFEYRDVAMRPVNADKGD
ncbi:unnamed protein product [Protopolystoma xenopodis]|uniref:Uncharacterized protein n=1 Tax=Protopolystoma xenopodis TaxID=117903 RepID=A0A3S5AM54_9PLAT|nr:unnamed protein product [Protopolystoma xenopodis]